MDPLKTSEGEMIAYRQTYRPAYAGLAQARPPAPPPAPDVVFTGYTGLPGFFEGVAVITVMSTAAWVGIRTGLKKTDNAYVRAAGWVGGVGAALIGLLYLGAKSGVGLQMGLPAMRISPV